MGSKRFLLIGIAILLAGLATWQTLKLLDVVQKAPPELLSGPVSMLALLTIIMLIRKPASS